MDGTANLRYDGSSRFADGNQWGFFPSVSVGGTLPTNLSEDMKETVSSFKLRMSYGALGNQSVPLYLYIPKLDSNADNINYPFDGKVVNQGICST